jgi:hypothetical protein
VTHATEQQSALALDEGQRPPAEATPAPAQGLRSMTESLPSALEPELRRIIDTAVARVAAIELEAIREARELTQRSEEEARQALSFALDRAFNLINTLELLAATVGGMAEALKIELDDAIDALRNVPQPESELAKELAKRQPTPAQEPQPAPQAVSPPAEPAPEPVAQAEPEPVAHAEPVTPPESAVPAEPVAPEAPAPEPQAVAEAPPAEPQPEVVEQPEEPKLEAVKPEQLEKVAEDTSQEVSVAASRSNGYPPADRQAESLAAATSSPDQEPERPKTVMHTPESSDGRPAVPTRRRGLMRRLFG